MTPTKTVLKYVYKFKRHDQSVAEVKIGDKTIKEAQFIAEAFPRHFPSVFLTLLSSKYFE
jgi:hypothetical protein